MTESIGGTHHVVLQKRETRRDSWTSARRAAFLAELESSCNATRACRAAGVSRDSAYGLRRRDPAFAAAWTRALDDGCENLRAMLVARALGTADAASDAVSDAGADTGHAPVEEPMSDETRLKVLQICRAAAEGRQGRASWRRPPAFNRTTEEVFAALAGKLDRVEPRLCHRDCDQRRRARGAHRRLGGGADEL